MKLSLVLTVGLFSACATAGPVTHKPLINLNASQIQAAVAHEGHIIVFASQNKPSGALHQAFKCKTMKDETLLCTKMPITWQDKQPATNN